MRFFADRTTTLLQIFHVIVDGLYDSVPILLSFMIVAFGAQEKDAGVILSVAALLGTLAGLGTKGCSQRFGFLRTLCLITGAYGVGYAANTFSQNIWFSGFFFVIAMMGYGVFHNAAFSYLTVRTERSMLGKVLGDFTAIGDIGRIPITAFAGFLAAWSFAGIPGWRIVCALFGAVACCITLYLLWTWLRNGDAGGSPCEERKKPQSLLPPLSLLHFFCFFYDNTNFYLLVAFFIFFYFLLHSQIQALRLSISQSKFLHCSHLLFSHLLCFRLVNVPHLRDGSPAHFQNFLSHMLLRWYFPHKLQNLLSPEPEISLKLIKYKYIQERAT